MTYTTTIAFHPRFLPDDIQTLIVNTTPGQDNGWVIELQKFVPNALLQRHEANAPHPSPFQEDAITRLENRLATYVERMEKIEQETELSHHTQAVNLGKNFESPTPPSKSPKIAIKVRIQDYITPRHLWSVSLFYLMTLLIAEELSVRTMTPGNWVLIWIALYNFLAIIGRDPSALFRIGDFVKDLGKILQTQDIDVKTFMETAAAELEIREKKNLPVHFRDLVGPIDMIILLTGTIFFGGITGLIFPLRDNPAFLGLIGMVIWGVLAILGFNQPNFDELLGNLGHLIGQNFPVTFPKNALLRAKFGK